MPGSNRVRDSSSRRSRSSGSRSRSRHRSRSSSCRHHRHRSRQKYKEKNIWSALCNMAAIVIMCTSLAEPRWISVKGGGCRRVNCKALDHLGPYLFFYPGKFVDNAAVNCPINNVKEVQHYVYKYGPDPFDALDNCVTYKAVVLMKTIIAFTFIAMVCTLVAFVLDLVGPIQRSLKILHRNAILSIIAVILCVIVNLFCYWLTAEVNGLQKISKLHTGSKVVVTFDVAFYLIAAAGGMGVFATAMNCLKRHPVHEENQSEALLEDYDGMEGLVPQDPDAAPLANIPPPPAYSP